MKKIQLKKENGFAASDGLIAILIITLFTGIIAALTYNIYLSNTSLKRMSNANGFILDIFEYIDKIYYDDTNSENLKKYFNEKYYYESDKITPKSNAEVQAIVSGEVEPNTPYKVIIDIQNYNEENIDRLDLVKEITMTVKYKLENKNQEITIKRAKNREQLVIPNKPDLNKLALSENQKVYPVKLKDGKYIVCDQNDNYWYNYENNLPAIVIVTELNFAIGEDVSDSDIKYKWIPRYAENIEGDIKYLYSNTNKYVEEQNGYAVLEDIDSSYNLDPSFTENPFGIWQGI